MWLRQSTASQEILLGPFLDSTDGNTAETGLTIANTDIKLWKEGATTEANKNSGGATHIAGGRYYAVLDATDTNTLGKLEVNVHVAGALAVRREFMVVPAMIYDSIILGTDRLDTNTTHVADTAQTANDNGADINAILVDTNSLNDTKIPDTISLANINAEADTALSDFFTSVATLVDLIWDEVYTGHTTNQTFGKILKGIAEGWISTEGAVDDAGATTTSFITDLTSARDDFYNDAILVFITETVADTVKGVGRPITSYTASTKTVTFDEAWPAAPADTDQFIILNGHTHPVSEIADGVWDEVLTGATHNVNNSAGKRLRGVDDAFEVHSGTAQAGAAGTITLDTGASATDDIYRGDRIVIVAGTGEQEHGICVSYNGTTKVATMAENWVITPDATSEFEVVPADVDVETWQHAVATKGATSGFPVVDAQAISDSTAAADNVEANIGNLDASIATVDTVVDSILANLATVDTVVDGIQTDLSNGTDGLGALKALIDTLDTVADAVKAKTDSLTFTIANQVDSNVQSINDVTITGDGSATPFDV